MKVLLKSVRICDKNSSHNGKVLDVLIENGVIKQIGKSLSIKADTINAKGMWLTPGWVDTWASFNDPGLEFKEDVFSGREAAFKGGFTSVAVSPDTMPIIQTKNEVKYILGKNGNHATEIFPIVAITRDFDGVTLTEMIDLEQHGAVAFSDGKVIDKGETVVKALRYLQKFNGLLIQLPSDRSLSEGGQMNEGEVSTYLGMKGIPNLAEEVIIQRDLELLKYAGGRLHFANVSTPKGLEMIRKAKKTGLAISCSIASYQLSFSDKDLEDFDTNLKVNPPFRTSKDSAGIVKYLADGTIDIINSHHRPQDEESKKLEFDLADEGIISLQTVGHNLVELSEEVPMEALLEKVSSAPRELLNLPEVIIREGETANVTLFDPACKWKFTTDVNESKSDNSPYLEKELKGRVRLVINGDFNWRDESL